MIRQRSSRRNFLGACGAGLLLGGLALPKVARATSPLTNGFAAEELPFKISLAEWSLHRTLQAGKMTNLEFARTAKQDFGIEAIEYVNSFFKDKANDQKYLADLNARAKDNGVTQLLIMCDGEGDLGDPDEKARKKAVENHHRWVDAAKTLGCHSIRVNAASKGSFDEQIKLAADGLAQLSDYAKKVGLNVIVENHGGLSSNGEWLAKVMKMVGKDNCGTLPDFGNFRVSADQMYDRYLGVEQLMPFAKAVSAKSHEFDANGNDTQTDYMKMMKIVLDAGYHGYVGIEFEGGGDEATGIRKTKALLERCQKEFGKKA
jgi:L-ribulose-5-phosphate 3-epimerase